jgi:hypothetical protein
VHLKVAAQLFGINRIAHPPRHVGEHVASKQKVKEAEDEEHGKDASYQKKERCAAKFRQGKEARANLSSRVCAISAIVCVLCRPGAAAIAS